MKSILLGLLVFSAPLMAQGQTWRDLLQTTQHIQSKQQLEVVNRYFNEQIRYQEDLNDHWQSLAETLRSGAGDCEDFALSKYQTLLASGTKASNFSFVYALRQPDQLAHIALLYKPGNLVLDNLTNELKPITARADLSPVLEFTATNYQLFEKQPPLTRAELVSLQRWQKILRLAEQQSSKDLYD